ncbi:MAG: Hpt domain-containing protein [Pseudobacteriovorax sp.]|nr:Hpt domain-containing protein [Pseudobacteriovorax sp.]
MRNFPVRMILILLFCRNTYAETTVSAEDIANDQRFSLKDVQEIYFPGDEDVSYKDIVQGKYDKSFARDSRTSFGFMEKPYWIKFRVENTTSKATTWNLSFEYPLLSHVALFVRGNPKPLQVSGAKIPIKKRSIHDRKIAMEAVSAPKSNTTYYLRIQTKSTNRITATFQSPQNFHTEVVLETYIYSITMGAFLIMFLYNFSVAIALRKLDYTIYSLFIGVSLLREYYIVGFSQYFLWPTNTSFNIMFGYQMMLLSMLLANIFAILFLELKSSNPRLHKFGMGISVWLVGLIVYTFVVPYSWSIKPILLSVVFNLLYMFGISAYRLKQGYRPAFYFTMAWAFPIFGFLATIAVTSGVSIGSWVRFSSSAGQFLELVFLSFAFGDRIKKIRQEKEAATRTLNKQLTRFNEELSQQVKEKTRDIRTLLNTINQGIFTVTKNDQGYLQIDKEYSHHLEHIFPGSNIALEDPHNRIFDKFTMSSENKHVLKTVLESSVGEDVIQYEVNDHLIPKEVEIKSEDKDQYLELEAIPIVDTDQDIMKKLLFSVRDVTTIKNLKKKSEKHEAEMKIFYAITESKSSTFQSFIESTESYLNTLTTQLSDIEADSSNKIIDILRILHTIKGIARTCRLQDFSNKVHEMEETFLAKQNDFNAVQKPELSERLETLKGNFAAIKAVAKNRFGLEPGKVFHRVEQTQLSNWYSELAAANLPKASEFVLREIKSTYSITLTSLLKDLEQSSYDIAERLGKGKPEFSIVDPGLSIIDQKAHVLRDSLVHLVRNSLDHGLEFPLERRKHGKSEGGMISVDMSFDEENHDRVIIDYWDDGAGLCMETLEAKARKQGILSDSEQAHFEALANLVFIDGFSTKEKATDISGRGVGMGAVRSFIRNTGGDLIILPQSPQTPPVITSEAIEQDPMSSHVPCVFRLILPISYFESPEGS